jgi:ribosome-associated protein
MDIRKLQRAIVDGLEEAKAQDIAVFNTEHLSPLFERVIIATGASNRQTKALASRVREAVRAAGFTIMRTEGADNGEWIIVDCAAAVVHIMQPAIRQYYQLEEIWGGKPVSIKLKSEKVGLVKASEPMDDEDAPVAKSARKPAAKKAAAKVAAKKAPARKTAGTAAKTAAKPASKPASGPKTPARKIALKSAGASVAPKAPAKTASKKVAAKKAPAKVTKIVVNAPTKPAAKKVAAKKAAVRAAAPKPVIKKVAGKKAAVKKVAAKKAAPRSRG